MTELAIRARDLGKQYRLGERRRRSRTARDAISEGVGRLARRESTGRASTFWALHDVGFELGEGERLGVIGRNGAGKSTLLKILSRITEPTTGQVEIWGRVGALLEVGTGFHFELTGRENIQLNGAILGMSRAQISERLDEIVEFAEVPEFLDTPVKRYSSGMRLRLGFAVAAHLEPDILIIDEVLAVGDLAFQRKCLAKMKEVAGTGRTVIFVSHNLATVRELCERALVLDGGTIVHDGDVVSGLAAYTDLMAEVDAVDEQPGHHTAWRPLRLEGQGLGHATLEAASGATVEATLDVGQPLSAAWISLSLLDAAGERLATRVVDPAADLGLTSTLPPGRYPLRFDLPPLWLAPGGYSMLVKVKGFGPTGPIAATSDRLLVDVPGTMHGQGHDTRLVPDVAVRLVDDAR